MLRYLVWNSNNLLIMRLKWKMKVLLYTLETLMTLCCQFAVNIFNRSLHFNLVVIILPDTEGLVKLTFKLKCLN